MDRSQQPCTVAGDRLSTLGDPVLGHILSLLPTKEAARASLLSSRWRDVFDSVHTVSLEEPEGPFVEYDYQCDNISCRGPPPDPNRPPPFVATVSTALLARHGRRGAAPLRAVRVAMEDYSGTTTSSTVHQWVSCAVKQSAPALDVDLRLYCRRQLCGRLYSLRGDQQEGDDDEQPVHVGPTRYEPSNAGEGLMADMGPEPDDDSFLPSDDDQDSDRLYKCNSRRWDQPAVHTISRVLFSCATLRSLSLGGCLLAPPATIRLPTLETLLLSHVSDAGSDVQRLINSCPRLVDLTLEGCDAVNALSVLAGGVRLRRLALLCCHNMVTVAVDASELRCFEYRGIVPDNSFLTLHGGTRRTWYCKIDMCGEEVTSEEDLINLRQFLQLFASVKHLHLESARLGSGMGKDVLQSFPVLASLRHLELRGRLPDDDTTAVSAPLAGCP